jgi:translation initiation factor eIF-2B subunit gamma
MKLYTRLQDAHVYLMKRWLMDYALERKTIASIKGDMIPFLVKLQFCDPAVLERREPSIRDFVVEDPLHTAKSYSTTLDREERCPPIDCHVSIVREGYCARANTTASFAEINKQLCRGASSRLLDVDKTPLVHPTTDIQASKGHVGRDCMVGEGSRVGEHSTLKRSVVGKHCVIGRNVKIANSLLLDYITVEDK